MPRMQAAQWRARDVSRKTALSQIQSAIVTSQWDKWRWPGCTDSWCPTTWLDINDIKDQLQAAWMNGVPSDPTAWNKVTWLWNEGWAWQYRYLVTQRNWAKDWWFVLMAKTEVEWWSNWIACTNEDWITFTNQNLSWWYISRGQDISEIHPCTEFNKVENGTIADCKIEWQKCSYISDDQLRYIVLY